MRKNWFNSIGVFELRNERRRKIKEYEDAFWDNNEIWLMVEKIKSSIVKLVYSHQSNPN